MWQKQECKITDPIREIQSTRLQNMQFLQELSSIILPWWSIESQKYSHVSESAAKDCQRNLIWLMPQLTKKFTEIS